MLIAKDSNNSTRSLDNGGCGCQVLVSYIHTVDFVGRIAFVSHNWVTSPSIHYLARVGNTKMAVT